ncbi:hypothetical protein [Candidatus Cyanaurora vandensis]|uniref:hypothetical protein n=1 Tax=Candidatus Cyanaurora vandensis TaxID=2714958 RepID=UPI00257F5712|nr:hypothetical protein [Candidatus Cyanaurora vandensis]
MTRGFSFGFGCNPFDQNFGFCNPEPLSRKERLQRKVRFLKRLRDDLEARLAGLNASISTIERQLSEEDVA